MELVLVSLVLLHFTTVFKLDSVLVVGLDWTRDALVDARCARSARDCGSFSRRASGMFCKVARDTRNETRDLVLVTLTRIHSS